ncbi:MAG TPA: hypothetical protein VF058_08910 [Actinomycetota bacterium]
MIVGSRHAQSFWRRSLVLVAALAVALTNALPAEAVAPQTVVATNKAEWKAAATDQWLAWTVWTGRADIVYAKPVGGSRFRVNRKGSNGVLGAIDGTTLVYQEFTLGRRGRSSIWFMDLETRTKTKAPGAVNSRQWEYWPSLSGDWLLFARHLNTGGRRLYLFNRTTQERRLVASMSRGRRVLLTGQVRGEYVSFEKTTWDRRGRATSCNVYRYDIASSATTLIPNPEKKCQWGPSVNDEGTVYFARGGFACGRGVSLRSHPIGGPTQVIWQLPKKNSLTTTYAWDREDDATNVYFGTYKCGRWADIKMIPGL